MEKGEIIYININGEHMYIRLLEAPSESENGVSVKYDRCFGLNMGSAVTPDGRLVIQSGLFPLGEELGLKEAEMFIPKDKINIFATLDKSSKMYAKIISNLTGISLPVAAPNPTSGSQIVLGK